MAINDESESSNGRLNPSKDSLFIVRFASVEAGNENNLQNFKKSGNENRSLVGAKLAHSEPAANSEQLARKTTSGRASSPAGSPKSSAVAVRSSGTAEVNQFRAAA